MEQKEHLKRDISRFGHEFIDVHTELDSNFKENGFDHRKDKHTIEFVLDKVIKREWTK